MRKLASVRKIHEIASITGADAIELAKVDGWQVVVKKDEYQVNDLVIYLEIDSWVPNELAPFLSKGKEPKEFEGVKGERLRTIKLRGCLSQGLILPIINGMIEGDDVTDFLNIKKWDRPLPAQLVGQAKGFFPEFLRKTDQERAQNLQSEIAAEHHSGSLFEVTVKLDGSSITVYHKDGEVGVCSRNLELKLNEENQGNTLIKTATNTGLLSALKALGKNIAVQGELMGEGIQGNREKLSEHNIFVFDIFDIDEQRYLNPDERLEVYETLSNYGFLGSHCPLLEIRVPLISADINNLLSYAEGESLKHPIREGLVYKRMDGKFSFKTISNKFLLGEK